MTDDKNTPKLHALILAGGSGTRLWPLSREEMPKQFLAVCGSERTLLQQTADRLLDVTDKSLLRVIASGKWRSLIAYQLMDADFEHDFVTEEPEGRNTAPAIAYAMAEILRDGAGDEDIVLVCPSDQLIEDRRAFANAVASAVRAASQGRIVTFGIKPTAPETGFGYVRTKAGEPGDAFFAVDAFVEKPDRATAEGYLASGNYYWNGGIFCFRVGDMIAAFEAHFPEALAILSDDPEASRAAFCAAPKESIDYAVMEKVSNIACVPLDAGWSDVGSWDAVFENSCRDARNNAITGNVMLNGGGDNLIVGHDRLVCGVDLDSMIVIDTPDALFVSPRGSSQRLREVVRDLAELEREELSVAPIVARQWGTYRILSKGDRHKIKRIEVSPGRAISLQYHMHRSEHWVVVRGTAWVQLMGHGGDTDGGQRMLLHEGESVFVPKGRLHRMENAGKIPLEIIEVQIGEYVGEDDIVRIAEGGG